MKTEETQTKPTILFHVSPIKSHFIPSFYLANMLSWKYSVHYTCSSNDTRELAREQGFITHDISDMVVGSGREESLLKRKRQSCVSLFFSRIKNDLYKFRKREFLDIISEVNPILIIIDIFLSTDAIAFYNINKSITIVFLNPMLSTYRTGKFPAVNEDRWPNEGRVYYKKTSLHIKHYLPIIRSINGIFKRALFDYMLKKNLAESKICSHSDLPKNITHTILFDKFYEIMLSPLELEFDTSVGRSNQLYLGLCIDDGRITTKSDDPEQKLLQLLSERRQSGSFIIYCAFGSFYDASNRPIIQIVRKLIEVLENADIYFELVLSINSLVRHGLGHSIVKSNIHTVENINQLKILGFADLFITHGGLGSIKESIYHQVPMLVCPLDKRYDQFGNAMKVSFHGLGISRKATINSVNFDVDSIMELMNSSVYRDNLKNFKEKIEERYTVEYLNSILMKLGLPAAG